MSHWRLTLLLLLVGAWLALIVVRLGDLQVRRYESYRERAARQQQRVVVLHPPRGTIFDARGRELAVSVEARSVAADPGEVEDPAATAKALARLLDVDVDKLARDLASDRAFVWVERKVDPPLARQVEALELKGVFTLAESKRHYPMRRLASQVLGYVGLDNSGLAGLEFQYEKVVASEPGRRTVVRDARHGTVLHPSLEVAEAKPGHDLYLTLDAAIQSLVERELKQAVERSNARRGTVVVMDPRTGAVLAMASYPDFDPNHYGASPESHWRNLAVMDAYEPGSTFKMVTLAAALEANVVDPLERIDCEMGGITIDRVRIEDHKAFGLLTTREIIAKSSNVGAIKLGMAAGRERLYETIRAFGFGRVTGIDLPSESAGILRPLNRWAKRESAYVSFGQSLSVTALQLTNAFAAVANGGTLLQPYVVAEVGRGSEGRREVNARRALGTPISPSSVTQVRSMLESVVIEGTARAAAIPGYRAAGKTGTAQKAIPGQGYSPNKFVASFVGFAPIHEPAVACAVVLDEPWPHYHGGDVAAPTFGAIVRQVLLYLGVPPDGERPDPPWTDPPPLVAAQLAPPLVATQLAPAQTAVPQQPTPRFAAAPADTALTTPTPPGSVPDLAGLSARQAVLRSAAADLHLALNGHGVVTRQEPPPGTPAAAGGTVEVWLVPEALAPAPAPAPLAPPGAEALPAGAPSPAAAEAETL